MLIRRELPVDVTAIRRLTTTAFARPEQPDRIPGEAGLVDLLRASDAWIPALSLVAVDSAGAVVGHILGSRGRVGEDPAVGLGPMCVHPDHRHRGIGSALVHTFLGAADALDEELVAVLGEPGYYRRFGFRPADEYGIEPPVADWRPSFQVRTLAEYDPSLRGTFTYPEPFATI